jgi:hypothetical protein
LIDFRQVGSNQLNEADNVLVDTGELDGRSNASIKALDLRETLHGCPCALKLRQLALYFNLLASVLAKQVSD